MTGDAVVGDASLASVRTTELGIFELGFEEDADGTMVEAEIDSGFGTPVAG